MEPDPFSQMVSEFTRWGVGIVGGCCGTQPDHIAKLYEAVHGHSYAEEEVAGRAKRREPLRRELDNVGEGVEQHARRADDPEPRSDDDR